MTSERGSLCERARARACVCGPVDVQIERCEFCIRTFSLYFAFVCPRGRCFIYNIHINANASEKFRTAHMHHTQYWRLPLRCQSADVPGVCMCVGMIVADVVFCWWYLGCRAINSTINWSCTCYFCADHRFARFFFSRIFKFKPRNVPSTRSFARTHINVTKVRIIISKRNCNHKCFWCQITYRHTFTFNAIHNAKRWS